MAEPSPLPRIDLVYTWVDGADPVHRARRDAARQALAARGPTPAEREVWYRGVGEIGYSVRSALAAMPWVGTIHIVTDNQTPPVDADLVASGRVRVVDHREIVPEIYRPVFASTIIESFLHRIPGLSDIWLYNNDDFFTAGTVDPGDFVETTDTGPLRLILRTVPAAIRVALKRAADWSPPPMPRANAYTAGIAAAALLSRREAGLPWRHLVFPRHLTQVYRSETAQKLEELLPDALHAARLRHFRGPHQISWNTLAYSAECHWFGARQRRHRPFSTATRSDELFVDFGRIRPGASMRAAWEKVGETEARFLCLNNIPQQEAAAFSETMEKRGLGRINPAAGSASS